MAATGHEPREPKLFGRKKHCSGRFCSAPACANSSGKDLEAGTRRSYYTFPLNDEKRMRLWMKGIPRWDWYPTRFSWICSEHFKGGKKTNEKDSEGYAPTIFTKFDKLRGKVSTPRSSQTSKKAGAEVLKPLKRKATLDHYEPDMGRPKYPKPSEENVCHRRAVWNTTDHDYNKTKVLHGCMTELDAMKQENTRLRQELADSNKSRLSLETIGDDDFPLWTNLPSRDMFMALAGYMEERGAANLKMWRGSKTTKHEYFAEKGTNKKPGPDRSMTVAEELFLVLVRLKTGFNNRQLARIFGKTHTTIGQIVSSYINFLSVELRYLFEMPDVNDPENVADCFKAYPNLKTIIDCTEIHVEKPHDLQARKELFSNYKGRETLKFLVGLSPYLYVNYVSEAWGGRASDKHITLASQTLLDALSPGSAVMTDRGFNVNEELRARGVQLIIPDFKGRGRSQLSRNELASSERIAESRIHVERIIQRIRTFRILDSRARLSMQDIIEQVFVCCAYLVNFQPSIIR